VKADKPRIATTHSKPGNINPRGVRNATSRYELPGFLVISSVIDRINTAFDRK
jgi:hypothetical protein